MGRVRRRGAPSPKSYGLDSMCNTLEFYPLATAKDFRSIGENNGENGENNDEKKVLDIIRKTPNITQPQIAVKTGFSTRKVNRLISALRTKGKIVRIGKTKGGHWEIND